MSPGTEESRSLQFFHERTKPSLALFNSVSVSFWTIVVPQMANMEDTIRFQIIAMASAQELSMSRKPSPRITKLLIGTYSKALRVIAYDKSPRVEIILTSCLLSIAMESVQAHYSTAYKHLCSGLAVLDEWKHSDKSKQADPEDMITKYLEPIYEQLAGTFGLQYGDTTTPLPFSNITWKPTMPSEFTSLDQARESLASLAAYIQLLSRQNHAFMDSTNPTILTTKQSWSCWTTAFHALRPTLTSSLALRQWKLLSIFATTHHLAFLCYNDPTESQWDIYLPQLRTQVSLCAEIDADTPPTTTYTTKDATLMEPGIIVPLWQIAIGCRDPTLRRRAVELMRSHHRKCGHEDDVDACLIALHAEATIKLEEEAACLETSSPPQSCMDVPEKVRIRPVAAGVYVPGFLSISYMRAPYDRVEYHVVPFEVGKKGMRGKEVQMWPMSKVMRLAGYQLLIRPEPNGCRCRSFGEEEDY